MADTATAQATTDAATAANGVTDTSNGATADATSATTAAAALVSVVPEKYDLQLPKDSTVDPAIVERTAAKARALGLSNEAGQTLLDSEVADAVEREQALATEKAKAVTDAQTALIDAWKPNGVEWKKQQAEWVTAAKADPTLGKTPEEFAQSLEKGQQALAKYGTPELKTFLTETGYGSHPEVIKFLTTVGRAMAEGTMPTGGIPSGTGQQSAVNLLFGKSTPEP